MPIPVNIEKQMIAAVSIMQSLIFICYLSIILGTLTCLIYAKSFSKYMFNKFKITQDIVSELISSNLKVCHLLLQELDSHLNILEWIRTCFSSGRPSNLFLRASRYGKSDRIKRQFNPRKLVNRSP